MCILDLQRKDVVVFTWTLHCFYDLSVWRAYARRFANSNSCRIIWTSRFQHLVQRSAHHAVA